MMKKKLTSSSQKNHKDESMNAYNEQKEEQLESVLTGDSQDQEHWMLWLLARGGQLFLHWQICKCRIILVSGSRQEATNSVWGAFRAN